MTFYITDFVFIVHLRYRVEPNNSTLHVPEESKCLVRPFVCLFICLFCFVSVLYGLILIAGRSFSILLFLCLKIISKYQNGGEYMKNV